MKGRKTRLTPQEIRTKQFNKKLFGYDPDEVEAFLIEVGNAYEELLKEIDFLQVRTPEYKVKKLLEKTRREAEKIIQGKLEEKKELERQMEKLEIEVEKLRLLQKQILEKLRMTIVDITKIMEALKTDAEGQEKGGGTGTKGEGSTAFLQKQGGSPARGAKGSPDGGS